LACGGRKRGDFKPAEAAAEDAGERVRQRAGETGELCHHAASHSAQCLGADHDDGTGEPESNARSLDPRQLLILCQEMREQRGEQRRGGV
jgi:hypothetical protein